MGATLDGQFKFSQVYPLLQILNEEVQRFRMCDSLQFKGKVSFWFFFQRGDFNVPKTSFFNKIILYKSRGEISLLGWHRIWFKKIEILFKKLNGTQNSYK